MTKNVLSARMSKNDKIKVILIAITIVVVAIIAILLGKTFIDVEPPVQPEPVVRNFPLDDGEDPFRNYGEVTLTPEDETNETWEVENVSTIKQGMETLADQIDTDQYQEVVEATTPEVEVVIVETVQDAEEVPNEVIVKVENPNKHVHSYVENVVAPTTTSQGYTEHVCSCGDSYKDSFVEALHSHNYISHVVDATCENNGYTEHVCECGDSYVDSYTEALGHDFGNNNPTCSHCNESNPSYVEEEMTITNDIDFGAGK